MPIPPNPPSIVQQVDQSQSPLMSEMIKRAAAQTPLDTSSNPIQAQGPQSQPSMKWPMIALGLGQGADNFSTNVLGLGHGEVNPLLPKPGLGNALAQGATTAGLLYAMHKLGPNHPTLAKVLGYGLGGLGAADTANNLMNGTLYGIKGPR